MEPLVNDTKANFYGLRNTLIALVVSAAYLMLSALLVGFKSDQVFLCAVFLLCWFLSSITRKLILGFSIFIVYWIVFDYMKAFPNYLLADVHIESLYRTERSLFGIHLGNEMLTPNEYCQRFSKSALDLASGIFYLSWVPVPLAFAAYLFFKNKDQFLAFSLTFLLTNLLGFVVYYIYPAAPPWYVAEHGFAFSAHTPGNAAGLARFDKLMNTGVFAGIYQKSSNVFAAMPSLHASYPLLVFWYGIKNRVGFMRIVFGVLMLGIWFSAVYSNHHYVLDVLAGICCGSCGIALFNFFSRRPKFKDFLVRYRTRIS